MNKKLFLIGYSLGLWGILGFFATLLFGFLACCANLSAKVFYISLIVFAFVGITISLICVLRGCKKLKK